MVSERPAWRRPRSSRSCSCHSPRRLPRRYSVPARGEQHALVNPADANQDRAEADKRKRAENTGQVRHINQKNLADGQRDNRGGGKARRLRLQPETRDQQQYAEDEPDRGISVL